MKYELVDTGNYKATQIDFGNGWKTYINHLHPEYETIVTVLEDTSPENYDIIKQIYIFNLLGLKLPSEVTEAFPDALNTVYKAVTPTENIEAETAVESIVEIPVTVEELTKLVGAIAQSGEAISFDYIVQTDFDNEADFPYKTQSVFPVCVIENELLAVDGEGKAFVYQIAGMSNLFYFDKNVAPVIEVEVPKKKSWWRRIFS